jgi:hypothetical protein
VDGGPDAQPNLGMAFLPIRCGEGIILRDDFPAQVLAHQHRAYFRYAFSVFEFAFAYLAWFAVDSGWTAFVHVRGENEG